MNGSWMKKFSASVFCARNGSMKAVATSGQQQHVRLVDRLEAADRRSVEGEAVGEDARRRTDSTGRLKCCITPGRSQNRTSTNFTSSFLRYRSSSSGLANTRPPGTSTCGRLGSLATLWPTRLPGRVSYVSAVLRHLAERHRSGRSAAIRDAGSDRPTAPAVAVLRGWSGSPLGPNRSHRASDRRRRSAAGRDAVAAAGYPWPP